MPVDFRPYEGYGPLEFGLKRAANRARMEGDFEARAMADGELPMDVYEDKGVFIAYDQYDRCGAIEVFPPGQVMFEGKDLLQLPWAELRDWFHQLDPDLDESEKGWVSYKYGIWAIPKMSVPGPKQSPKYLTLFRKDFFYVKNGIPDPQDISSFHLQVAYVEPIQEIRQTFPRFTEAWQSIFARNREYAILSWNSIPLRFSYQEDLPTLLEPLLGFVQAIIEHPTGNYDLSLECRTFSTQWSAQWNEQVIQIKGDWNRMEGGFAEVLNDKTHDINQVTVLKSEFLAEWKMLFHQCIQAFDLSKAKLNRPADQELWKKLQDVEKQIPAFGKFYKAGQKVLSTEASGRKIVDLKKLPQWAQTAMALLIVTFVVVPVYLLSRNQDSIFWMWKNVYPLILFMLPFLLITFYWIYRIWRKPSN